MFTQPPPHTHMHKRQNRKEVRKVGAFSLSLDPLQQFLFSGFHFVACIVPCVCVCVVPCVLHVRQREWMNRGGAATKDKVGGAGHTTALLSVFFFFVSLSSHSVCHLLLSCIHISGFHLCILCLYFVCLFIHSSPFLFLLSFFPESSVVTLLQSLFLLPLGLQMDKVLFQQPPANQRNAWSVRAPPADTHTTGCAWNCVGCSVVSSFMQGWIIS